MRNGNEACLTTTSMKSGHRSKVKVVLALGSELNTSRAKPMRSEEHTSELQSLTNLVCRLLLEKKKKNKSRYSNNIYKTQETV